MRVRNDNIEPLTEDQKAFVDMVDTIVRNSGVTTEGFDVMAIVTDAAMHVKIEIADSQILHVFAWTVLEHIREPEIYIANKLDERKNQLQASFCRTDQRPPYTGRLDDHIPVWERGIGSCQR